MGFLPRTSSGSCPAARERGGTALWVGSKPRLGWYLFAMGVQNTLAYRVNFVFRAVFNLIPMVAIISMWQAIYAGKTGEVGNYTLAAMVTYYVLVAIVEALTAVTEDDWQIAAEIKDGQISQFLTRPLDYLHYRLCLFISGRVVYAAAAVLPVGFFVFWHREQLLALPDLGTLVAFGASVVMSAILQFLLSYLVAMLAFWVVEISTFVFILMALERLASGQLFPLDLLPGAMMKVLMWTPFPYGSYFPVSIYLGRLSGGYLAQGLLLQACWLAAVYGLARWVWQRGLKAYTVVGG